MSLIFVPIGLTEVKFETNRCLFQNLVRLLVLTDLVHIKNRGFISSSTFVLLIPLKFLLINITVNIGMCP